MAPQLEQWAISGWSSLFSRLRLRVGVAAEAVRIASITWAQMGPVHLEFSRSFRIWHENLTFEIDVRAHTHSHVHGTRYSLPYIPKARIPALIQPNLVQVSLLFG